MAVAWSLLALWAPHSMLVSMSSSVPWLLLFLPLITLWLRRPDTPNVIFTVRTAAASILLSFGLHLGHHALVFFSSGHLNPETLKQSLSMPWFLYGALLFMFLQKKENSYRIDQCMPPTFLGQTSSLIVLQIAKIPIGFLIPMLSLPLVFGLFYTLPEISSVGNHHALLLGIPFLYTLQKRVIKTATLRSLIHQGVPLLAILILFCLALIMTQSLLLNLMNQVPLPLTINHWLQYFQHPWPTNVTAYSAIIMSWSWWLLLAIPTCGRIAYWLQKKTRAYTLLTLLLLITLSDAIPIPQSSEQALLYALGSFFILGASWLSKEVFNALHLGCIPLGAKQKDRNPARQFKQALMLTSLSSTTIIAIGGDFIFWGLAIGLCTLTIFLWLSCYQMISKRVTHATE